MPPLVKLRLRRTFIDFYPDDSEGDTSPRARRSLSSPPGFPVVTKQAVDDLSNEYLRGMVCRMMHLPNSSHSSDKDCGYDRDSQSTSGTLSQTNEMTDQCVSEQDVQSSASASQAYSAEGSVSDSADPLDSASSAGCVAEHKKKQPVTRSSSDREVCENCELLSSQIVSMDGSQQEASRPHEAQQLVQASPIQDEKQTLLLQLCLHDDKAGDRKASTSTRSRAPPVECHVNGIAELLSDQVQEGKPSQCIPLTTLMIRNIPCKVKMKALLDLLNSKGFAGTFDFLYLPVRGHHSSNLGYAFINFRSATTVAPFMFAFNGVAFSMVSGIRTEKVIEIRPARVQGLAGNIAVVREILTKDDEKSLFLMQGTDNMYW